MYLGWAVHLFGVLDQEPPSNASMLGLLSCLLIKIFDDCFIFFMDTLFHWHSLVSLQYYLLFVFFLCPDVPIFSMLTVQNSFRQMKVWYPSVRYTLTLKQHLVFLGEWI